jgi:uncharacterized protein with GYD domain
MNNNNNKRRSRRRRKMKKMGAKINSMYLEFGYSKLKLIGKKERKKVSSSVRKEVKKKGDIYRHRLS